MQSTNLAADVENYLAGLIVPQGRFQGEPFPVFPWESKFVAGAFKPGVLDAALTVARGNGKSYAASWHHGCDGRQGRAAQLSQRGKPSGQWSFRPSDDSLSAHSEDASSNP